MNNLNKYSIAIDGPAGSGKSTIAKILADKLDITYIDTGAMFRAITFKIYSNNIDINKQNDLEKLLETTEISFTNGKIILDGNYVEEEIRNNNISKKVSDIAKIELVRNYLLQIQRRIAKNQSVVMDGRDIGSVVLPDAEYKFFLNADVRVRAERRYKELVEKGAKNLEIDQIEKEIKERDLIDSTRAIAPLIKCSDAMEIDTTSKTIDQVVEDIINIIRRS